MKTYLEFNNDTSSKFWQIEVQDIQHTVTFGKINTDGQSKIKIFTTAEECLKDAEKMIKSKKAKGYAELSEKAVIPEKKSKSSHNAEDTTSSKSNKQQALDAFEQLIKNGTLDDIIPFLNQYQEGNSTILKKALLQAKRYWLDYQDLSKTPEFIDRNNKYSEWGRRGKERHQRIIHLLAFALLNESDNKSNWSFLNYIHYHQENTQIIDILKQIKPTWLGAYLKQCVIENPWTIDYQHLRQLEQDDLIRFDPQLFGLAVQNLRQSGINGQKITAKSTIEHYIQDPILVERDIPLMLDYETRPQDHWFGKWDDKINAWHDIFVALIQHQKIDRQVSLQKIIEMQTKDWNSQTKSFFKKVFTDLNLNDEELLALQDHLFVLLHSEYSATVGFALEQIKIIYQHPNFKIAEYLEWLEALMMRADLKNQVKTIILQLQNLLKNNTAYHHQILNLLADVFLQNDLSLQERSAKLLLKYQNLANDELKAKISSYQENLLGDIKHQLQDFFGEVQENEENHVHFSSSLSNYHYQVPEVDYLDDGKKVELINSWQDLLFFMAQLPHTVNPLDFDIFMSSWLTLRDQRPDDYKQQLEPILKSFDKVKTNATYKTIFQVYFAEYITEELDHWSDNFYRQQCNEHKILHCWIELAHHFTALDLEVSSLPLLSLPTHAPSYLDPEVFVTRLLAYETTQTNINFTDLALAIARMPRQHTESAIQLAQNIQTDWVKAVVLSALGSQNVPHMIPPQYDELDDDIARLNWRGLWATVIQTHSPYVIFTREDEKDWVNTDAQTQIINYQYTPRFDEYWDDKKLAYIKERAGDYVRFSLPTYQESSLPDLYHHQAHNLNLQNYYGWDYTTELGNAVLFRHFTPLNTTHTDLHVASNHCDTAERFSNSSAELLTRMMDEDYLLNPYSLFILATHLFASNKEIKRFAVESVIHCIYQSKIDLDIFAQHLATLLHHQFAPLSRLNESLIAIEQASPLHTNFMYQLFNLMLSQLAFKDKLPTQFKKFIELYYLVYNKQEHPVIADDIKEKLLLWQTMSASLKPLVSKLIT